MPRRADPTPYPQKARERIQADRVLKRLHAHSLSEVKVVDGVLTVEGTPMLPSQIKAAEILLRKCIPDLKSIEVTGQDGGPVQIEEVSRLTAALDLLQSHGIDTEGL